MNEALRVALAYNLKRVTPGRGGEHDEEAEYDGPSTIASIREAIASHGHEVIELEADAGFVKALLAARPDVVFNVSEGAGGRSREAHVPALLELMSIPYTGSDPACLVVTLDKAIAKAVLQKAGVRTPAAVVMTTGEEPIPSDLRFPVIVKPVAEGSSKGVLPASVATSEAEARSLARAIASRYRQGALLEEFLPGREFTVALLGGSEGAPPTLLPPMEIVLLTDTTHPVYAFHHKLEPTHEVRYEAPARISAELDRELRDVALAAYEALGCRDVARVDLRLDRDGRVSFIECNPLPGLTPGWSDICLIAESVGIDYRTLIGRILEPAIERFRRARGAATVRVEAKPLAAAL
jgi:D-alanine-D-alanine ligase